MAIQTPNNRERKVQNEQLLKRVKEHRVNTAFIAGEYFSAYSRTRNINDRKKIIRRWLYMLSILFSVITLSGLLLLMTGQNELIGQKLSLVSSILSIVITIYLSLLPEIKSAFGYLQRAENFQAFYKRSIQEKH